MSSRSERTIRQIRQILESSQDFERNDRNFSQNSPFSCYLTPRSNLYNQYPLRTSLTKKSTKKSTKKRKPKKTISFYDSRPFLFNNSNYLYHQLSNSAKKAFLPDSGLQSTSVQTSLGLILDQSDSPADPITAKQNEIMSFITIAENLVLKRFFNRWRQRWFFQTAYSAQKLIQSAGINSIQRHLKRTLRSNSAQNQEGRSNEDYSMDDQNALKNRRYDTRLARRETIPQALKNRLTQTDIQNKNGYYDENGYNSIFDFNEDYEYYEYDDSNDRNRTRRVHRHRRRQQSNDTADNEYADDYEYEIERKRRNKSANQIRNTDQNRQIMAKSGQIERSSRRHHSVDQSNARRSNEAYDVKQNDDDFQYNDYSMQNDRSNRNSTERSKSKTNTNSSDYSNLSSFQQKHQGVSQKDSFLTQSNRRSQRSSPKNGRTLDEADEGRNLSEYSSDLVLDDNVAGKSARSHSHLAESRHHTRKDARISQVSNNDENEGRHHHHHHSQQQQHHQSSLRSSSPVASSPHRSLTPSGERRHRSSPKSEKDASLFADAAPGSRHSSARNSPGSRKLSPSKAADSKSGSLLYDHLNQRKSSNSPTSRSRLAETSPTNRSSRKNSPVKSQTTRITSSKQKNVTDISNRLFLDSLNQSKQRKSSSSPTNRAQSNQGSRRSSPNRSQSIHNASSRQLLSDSSNNSFSAENIGEIKSERRNNSPENNSQLNKSSRRNSPHKSQSAQNTRTNLDISDESNVSLSDISINLDSKISQQATRNTVRKDSLSHSIDANHASTLNVSSKNKVSFNSQFNQNDSDYSNVSFNDVSIQTKLQQQQQQQQIPRKDALTQSNREKVRLSMSNVNYNSQRNQNESEASFNDVSIQLDSSQLPEKLTKSTKKESSQIQSNETQRRSQNNNNNNNNNNNSNSLESNIYSDNYQYDYYSNYSRTEQESNAANRRTSFRQRQGTQLDVDTNENYQENSKTFSPIKTPRNFDDVVSQIIPDLDDFIEKYSSKTNNWTLDNESDAEFRNIVEKSRFFESKYSHFSLDNSSIPEMIPVNTNLTPNRNVSSLNTNFDPSLPELHEFDNEITEGNISPPLYFNNQ